jgi:hypothetical protein
LDITRNNIAKNIPPNCKFEFKRVYTIGLKGGFILIEEKIPKIEGSDKK